MTYYNERNGWVDTGKLIDPKNTKCPNCGGNNYRETVSREYCPDCGMECDYWGGGSNEVYDRMCERKWAREEEEREARIKRQLREEWGPSWEDDI
jgi:ribosomal protein S27AE